MPDIEELKKQALQKLGGSKSIASSESSRNLNSQQYSNYNVQEVEDSRAKYAQEIKDQKAKVDAQLAEAGIKEEDVKKSADVGAYWNEIFNSAKKAFNALADPYSKEGEQIAKQSTAKPVEQIKDELLTAYNQNKAFDRALINGVVRNDDFGNKESLDENIRQMDEDDAFDNIKYALGIEQDRFGDKKLKLSLPDGSKYFYYLDKDEEGKDILAKTKIKNKEDIEKTGKAVLNAYGALPLNKGFAREFGAGLANTYSGLAKNLVNFNRGVSNVAAATLGSAPILGSLVKDYAEASTEFGKDFNTNTEIDQSKAGVGGTAEWLGGGIGQGASSLAQMAIMGNAARLLTGAIAPTASAAGKFDTLVNFGAGSVLNYNEAYESALKAGLSEAKAGSVGLLTGAINGLIESAVGTNRLVSWLGGGGDRALARTVLGELGEDVSQSSINRVFNDFKKGLTGDAGAFMNRIFENKLVGSAAEEGLEEFFQTFSQKGVENLYDLTVGRNEELGKGKFGTKVASKETLKEALESAFFGAILGFGGDISKAAVAKLSGSKQASDEEIIPLIAQGKRNEVEAIVKTLHNSKAITDQQREVYLNRVDQLDKMFQANTGTFTNLDKQEDTNKAQTLKSQALSLINDTFDIGVKNEALSKKLADITNNADLTDTQKQEQSKDILKDIRNNQLNIKFYNDYIAEQFTPQEDGTIQAYEDNYLNLPEIVQNKFQRFAINNEIKESENTISNLDNQIAELQNKLANPETITDTTPKEVADEVARLQRNLIVQEANVAEAKKELTNLNNTYSQITSQEYQDKLKTPATPEPEVTTTTPLEAAEEIQVENNTNTQEDVVNSPVTSKQALEQELAQINDTLANSAELDDNTINSLTDRASEIENNLRDLDNQTQTVAKDYEDFTKEMAERFDAVSPLENTIAEPALSAIKKEIEQTIAAFESNGINTEALKRLHGRITSQISSIRQAEEAKKAEADRLAQEEKDSKANDDKKLISNVNFFDRVQRLTFMNNNPEFYTDQEINDIFQNTPLSEILDDVMLVYDTAEDLGYTAGQKVGQFNSTTEIVLPKIVMSLFYKDKKIGNINQVEGFKNTENSEELPDPTIFNIGNYDLLGKVEDRDSFLVSLLEQKGMLTPADLAAIGFNFNWNGDFEVNKNTPRTLVKDFPAAQLAENGGKPYIIDTLNGANIEITEGTVNMRDNELVPPIPEGLVERYVVLVKPNNGKFYWVGAQNQVLSDDVTNKLYVYLFSQIAKLKTITDPDALKAQVSTINKYLSDNIFVTIPNADLRLTTPNKTNANYTLELKIKGQKGKRVVLDQSKFATIGALFSELGLDKTNLRATLANNAPAKETIAKLSINTTENVVSNPLLYKNLTFKVDNTKLQDMLANLPVVDYTTNEVEEVEEPENPFESYDVNADIEAEVEEVVVKDNSGAIYANVVNGIDPSFDTLAEADQVKVLAESAPLLEGYADLGKVKKRGIESKVKSIINKYRPSNSDPVFSIGTAEEIMDYPEAVQWLEANLPSSIGIADVNTLLGNIKNNGTTFGAFANNTIYLGSNAEAGTQYHEAFHAVFRMLISDGQIKAAYNLAAKKYGKATSADIEALKNSSSVYSSYTDIQLADLWLEEKMADEFKQYSLSTNRNNSGLGSIWNKILNWIRFVTGNMDQLQALFYNINRGKFKNATTKSNVFSRMGNQDKVFSIFNKGVDANNQIISTTQSEGAAIVASLTNKYLQGIIAGRIAKDDNAAKNALLDQLIADRATFYSLDDNPYYEEYLERTGLVNDDNYFETMSRNLEQKRNIFTLPANIAALKKEIKNKSQLFDIDETRNIEDQQAEVDDIGEQFERDVWTIGGETSFSKVLREYISLTTIATTDEYGQADEEAVDFKKVYRGLVRALGGVEEENVLPRFKALAEFDADINAVFNKLIGDLGLTNEGSLTVQDITKNYDLWRKFVTAFNNERVAWYTVLQSKDQSRLIESNNASAKDLQFNEWFQNYSITDETIKYDENLKKKVNADLDFINRSENITVATLAEAKSRSEEIKKAFRTVSIKLSNAYIAYSLLKKSVYEELDQDAKDYLNSFIGVEGLYDDRGIPFIVGEFKTGYNPFTSSRDEKGKERGAVNRIKQIAEQNALFDPTVGESSFQNADGKNVYSIIRPSFGLVKLRWLTDAKRRTQLLLDEKNKKDDFIDPLENIKLNHLLASENLDLIMQNLTPAMIDGYRQTNIEGDITKTEEGEGVTFGKFDARQYLLTDLLMFISNRKSLNRANESGKVEKVGESAMFNINQMEASNTGYGVFLPVQNFSTVNKQVVDTLFNYLTQEAIRIHKVKQNFGKGKTWLGYNDKEGARGFKLMEFAGYGLDQLIDEISTDAVSAEDTYSKLLANKEAIDKAITSKVKTDIEAYKEALYANQIIGDTDTALPKLELIKQGYLKDKEKIAKGTLDKLITDYYLNAYINTLGINNLLLDNYSKKVKNTVDWFKRAKGIIGSGPDMGAGITRVAVYKEPVKYINPATLADIDVDKLVSNKQDELIEAGQLSDEDIATELKNFEKDLKQGKIDIADAQSYVTLDHKILQLQRWGRYPAQVSDIYEKIKKGLNITFEEGKVLEKNNAALNSTKTVAYNGDFYFKLSELILSPRLVGKTDEAGNVIFDANGRVAEAKEGFEYLFNKYNAMLDQGIDQALPQSASKMATIAPAEFVEDGKFDFRNSVMELENKFKRLQVETPSGKSKIIHGTQLIQLVHSEQNDALEIDFKYNPEVKNLGQLRDMYRQLLADNRLEGFKTAIAYMRDPISGEFNSKELTKKFYDTIVASGSDEVLSNFFTPDHNGERQFNWNLGPVVNKAEQLFLAHFSKGVLSQKVPGLKVSLVSDTGILIKDKETGKMRSLAHMKADADGNFYSECLLPPFANELLGKDPSDERLASVLKMFGVRIPTQDKHSMMSLKVVGFLPVEYGSVGVFPKEIVFLSGADFDIDSEFIHTADFYTNKEGIPVLYGSATTNEGKYEEWKKWNLKNNKLLKNKFKSLGYSYSKATTEEIAATFKALAMPSSLEEFIDQKPINVGANNNAMLEAEIKFLTNTYVRNRAALIPASMDSIKAVAKTVSAILNIDINGSVSPNTPIARFNANRNNMEGKSGIGPVALSNVTHALLSTYGVDLIGGVNLPTISGKTAKGFDGIYTIGSETDRKNDNISTLLSAMTDNAKEQLAKLLNLTFNRLPTDTLPVASYMLAIGYTMEETVLFLNQPTIREYVTGDTNISKSLEKLRREYSNVTKDFTSAELSKFNDANIKALTIEVLENSLNEKNITDFKDLIHLDKVLETFLALKSQATYTNNVSSLLSLNKGLKSTFDDNTRLSNILSELGMSFLLDEITNDVDSYQELIDKLVAKNYIRKAGSKTTKFVAAENMPLFAAEDANEKPFDARLALLSDPNTIQNIIIHKKVMDTSKEFFLLNTKPFQAMRGLTSYNGKDLIPHFMDKAYTTYLEEAHPEKFEKYNEALNNAGYMVHKSGANSIGRELWNLKKDPDFRENLLIRLLTLKEPNPRVSSLVQIEFPTRVKAEGDFYTNLNNAFKELFMNPRTTDFARKLYYYSYFKDGLQFRNKSFINTIPSWVFKDVSTSLDLLNEDFKDDDYSNYSSVKEGLVPTIINMLRGFTKIEKTAKKLARMGFSNPVIITSTKVGEVVNTKLKEQSINYTNKRAYLDSLIQLTYDQKIGSNYTDFLRTNRAGLKYEIASFNESSVPQGTDFIDVVSTRITESIKSFDTDGNPVSMNINQIVEYYLENGSLPLAYEINTITRTALKEDGLNSTVTGDTFVDNMLAIKQAIPKVTPVQDTYQAQEILDQIPDEVIVEDTATDLENTENNTTFVNPFAGFNVAESENPEISMDDFAEFENYETSINQSMFDEESMNDLDNDVDNFIDDENNPLCS